MTSTTLRGTCVLPGSSKYTAECSLRRCCRAGNWLLTLSTGVMSVFTFAKLAEDTEIYLEYVN